MTEPTIFYVPSQPTSNLAALRSIVIAETTKATDGIATGLAAEILRATSAEGAITDTIDGFADQFYTDAIDSTGSTLTIAGQDSTSTLNLGTGTGVQVVNVGTTGTGNTTINLGGIGDTVAIQGTLTTVNTTNLEVTDKNILLNKNGLVGSGSGSGIDIEENEIVTGYVRVNGSRDAWLLKAPDEATPFTIDQSLATTDSPTFNTVTATLNGTATNFSGSLSGEVTGTQSATVLSNNAVIAKTLTGYSSTTGTISSSDSIVSAISKLNGNMASMSGDSDATANTLVLRDSNADFEANDITVSKLKYNGKVVFDASTEETSVRIGADAGSSSLPIGCAVVGYQAGKSLTGGIGGDHILIGREAGSGLTSGSGNVAIGTAAMGTAVGPVDYCVAIGAFALLAPTQNGSVAIGAASLNKTTSGFNVGLGINSGTKITTGTRNTILGSSAGYNMTTSSDATLVGHEAGYALVSGAGTAVGSGAMKNCTNSTRCVAVGYGAMGTGVNTGTDHVAIGDNALTNNTSGTQNVGIGTNALASTTTGSNNTALGVGALATNTTGNNNTCIGSGANVSTNNLTNATAIGNGALVTASNTMRLGNASVTDIYTAAKIHCSGLSIPADFLQLDGSWQGGVVATDDRRITMYRMGRIVHCTVSGFFDYAVSTADCWYSEPVPEGWRPTISPYIIRSAGIRWPVSLIIGYDNGTNKTTDVTGWLRLSFNSEGSPLLPYRFILGFDSGWTIGELSGLNFATTVSWLID